MNSINFHIFYNKSYQNYKNIQQLKIFWMIESDANQTKLESLSRKLATQHKVQDTINILHQIKIELGSLNIEGVPNTKEFLLKCLKPISKELTNINIRIFNEDKPELESLLILLVQSYAKAGRFRLETVCFELLFELLDSNTQLLKRNETQADFEEISLQIKSQMETELEWIVMKNASSQKNTLLFYRSINAALNILQGFQQTFPQAGMNLVRQYLSFLIKISASVKLDKLSSLSQKSVVALETLLAGSLNVTPPKQYLAQAIKGVSEVGIKLTNDLKKVEIKKRFDMLSSIYGLSLLSSSSIQKKVNGLKIINKESQHFYRSSRSFLHQEQFIEWLMRNKIIDMIYEQSSQTPIIKNCNYIFRIYFKRRCLNQSNFLKVFQYLEQTQSQNRQFVLRQLDLESIRLEYSDTQILIGKLKTIVKPEFYEEDFFSICTQTIRYCTTSYIKQYINALSQVLKKFHRKFRNERIQHKCIKCYVKAISRLLQKESYTQQGKKYLLSTYDFYFESQFTELGILLMKNIIEQLPEHSEISKSKFAFLLIKQKNSISEGLKALKANDIPVGLKIDIEEYLCTLLKLADELYGNYKVQFEPDLLLEAIHSPKMFEKISTFISLNEKLTQTYNKLLNRYQVQNQNVPFSCIRNLFCRINFIYMKQIKQYSQPTRYELFCKVSELKCVENLKYLMLNAVNSQNRNLIADFMSDLYTYYSENKSVQGEKQLEFFLKQTLSMTLTELKKNESELRVLGYLALIQSLMMATELIGVGKYRPHNSLVPISTVQIKIMNQATYGNDVAQSYWKKVSSNLTLFDLLSQMGEKFRCSPCQLLIQEGQKFWPEKWNGLILEELKIDDKFMKVIKGTRQKIRKQSLIDDGELSVKAKKVFEQIFNSFSIDGKMGKKQCSNFVAAVTKTSSSTMDGRVQDFFKEYDVDKDQNITLDDFLRFYKHHCSPERDEIVWKNLNNMRYRRDLKKYDDPIQIGNQNLLFRSILYKSEQFYNFLFSLSESPNKQMQERSKRILLRLPTFPKTLESVKSNLDLITKNSFQTEYLLIAIQSKLNSNDLKIQEKEKNQQQFIQSGNYLQIFQMMLRIDNIESMTQNQRKCLYISLQIQRSLLKVPNLKTDIKSSDLIFINLNLPETYLFKKQQQVALKHIDIDVFEAALALQLTQGQKQIQFCLSSVFHEEVGIRKICCNYIFVLYQLRQVKIDLFQIQQRANCQYWFQTLTKICALDNTIDFSSVIKKCLQNIKNRSESIQKNLEDPIIYGNLSIIEGILSQSQNKYEDISSQLIEISQIILSNKTRKLVYSILSYFDVGFAIQFVSNLIDSVQPVKQIEPKKFYVGLKNLGSTCYMNSILQVLFCVQQFKNLVLSMPEEELMKSEVNGKQIYDNTLYQLQKMYTNLMKSTKKFYNTQEFCLTIKNGSVPINVKIQEDAHQFAGKFLDKLEKQVEKTDKIQVYRQLLEGNTVTQIVCKKCSNKIMREEKFSQISLAVKDLKTLEQSFEKYIFPEQIQDYFCEICNCKVQKIEKSTYISKLPKLLTINLQRIIYDLQTVMFRKIDTNFTFPEELNIYNYVLKQSNLNSQECEYKLKAIIVHSGTSQSGHYYSIIRIGNEWFKFNDQTVTKIEYKDIPHECFGGSDSKQQWNDDLKFSTNAYMLFYESKSINLSQKQCVLNQKLVEQIKRQNQKFYKQLQVHQQSIFVFANELYQRFVPKDVEIRMKYRIYQQNWHNEANLQHLQAIYEFSIRLLKFATVFYDVKNELVFKISQNIFNLFFLLPEKSYQFLTKSTPAQFLENLCLHNDENIRNIYKFLLNKSMHVFINYYHTTLESDEQGMTQLIKILDCLFAYLDDQRFDSNMGKSLHFFEFWKCSCEYIPIVVDYLNKRQTIVKLIDKLMANESPLLRQQNNEMKEQKSKNKKRGQLPVFCGFHVTGIITHLLYRKKNFMGFANLFRVHQQFTCYQLTQRQRIMLSNISFYQKMIEKKYDQGNLGIVIAILCYKDENFSREIAPVYLKGLNNISYQQTGLAILNHIKFYLLIDDEFSFNRLKWVLGIPQLRMGNELVYGLTYDDESLVYQYVSPLYFVRLEKDQFEPALAIMYENRSTFNSFSVEGVRLLLSLMVSKEEIFKYLTNLPAPNYLHRSYLDWIQIFLNNFKDSYAFQEQQAPNKHEEYEKLVSMYYSLKEKVDSTGVDLPVSKKIIGRNKELIAVQSIYEEDYKITLWSHLTYVLPNEPTIFGNKSLPKELFKFSNPIGFAKYFSSLNSEMLEPSEELQSELTTYTLEIQAKQLLIIKFKLNSFNESISVYKGKIYINFPYAPFEGGLNAILEIKVMSKQQEMNEEKMQAQKQIQEINKDLMEFYSNDQIECKVCTFYNSPHRKMCQMCDNML